MCLNINNPGYFVCDRFHCHIQSNPQQRHAVGRPRTFSGLHFAQCNTTNYYIGLVRCGPPLMPALFARDQTFTKSLKFSCYMLLEFQKAEKQMAAKPIVDYF